MAIVQCTECGKKYSDRIASCPFCAQFKPAAKAPPALPVREAAPHAATGFSAGTVLAAIGTALLFIGVFSPIIRAPIVGQINYFNNGKGDGIFILVLAAVSLGCIIVNKQRFLLYTGLGSLGILAFTFITFHDRMNQIKAEMAAELAGNPFSGFADAAFNSVQMEWGWGVLGLGAVLQIVAARQAPAKAKEAAGA